MWVVSSVIWFRSTGGVLPDDDGEVVEARGIERVPENERESKHSIGLLVWWFSCVHFLISHVFVLTEVN